MQQLMGILEPLFAQLKMGAVKTSEQVLVQTRKERFGTTRTAISDVTVSLRRDLDFRIQITCVIQTSTDGSIPGMTCLRARNSDESLQELPPVSSGVVDAAGRPTEPSDTPDHSAS